MGAFKGAVITKKGQDLLAKLVQGSAKLTFTQIKTSENALKGDLASLTDIGTVKQTEKVASVTKQNIYSVKVSASFSNKELTEGYYIRNIGLYAMDPTEGEILYSISVADESTATADWMPPYKGAGVSSLMVDLITLVSNSDKVTVEVDPTAFATVAQIMAVNEHLTALDNTIITTTESALLGSVAGGLKINKVCGKSVQEADPTPDAPQDIKSVEVSEIKACGKNLLKPTAITTTESGVTFTTNADGSVTVSGTATQLIVFTLGKAIVKKGTTYILSGCPANGGDASYRIDLRNADTNDYLTQEIGEGKSFEADMDREVCVCARIASGQTVSNLTFYPMLRDTSITDNTYEPYTEKIIQLSQPITLHGIGDVCDELTLEGVVRRCFVESEPTIQAVNAITFSDGVGGYRISGKLSKQAGTPVDKLISSAFIPNTNWLVKNGCTISGQGDIVYMQVLEADFPSLTSEAFAQYVQDTSLTFVLPLAVPTVEPLPVEDKLALLSLVGNDGVTCLGTDSIIAPVIEVEYGTNKTGAHTLTGLLTAQRIELKMSELT